MAVVGWRFPPLFGGTRQGYTNNDIEAFKGEELIDNLAREICQNSLDAKNKNVSEPVKVKFELMHVPTAGYEVFSGYKKCIDGCRKYWGDDTDDKLACFLNDAEHTLSKDRVGVLVAGDYNTTGLTGSRTNKISSAWEALAHSDGVSVKSNDISGGSFGIGKNAPFACSSLSMVFYNTYADDNEKAFLGVARLATLFNENDKPTHRIGHFQKNDDEAEKWSPIFEEDINPFRDLFSRTEKGTDVIIIGFNEEENWIEKVEKAVIKNFFVAIHEGNLIVELKDNTIIHLIDASNLSQKISDFADDKEMKITSQLYAAFVNPDHKEVLTILQENDAEVYIKSDSSFARTIANFRSTGMLVGCKSRRIFQHYAAVLIIRGDELSELLRATEPPRHNRWDYKLINGETEIDKRRKAGKAIRGIDDSVLNLLKQQFEIVTEDSVDAAGVGEYLSDDIDELGGASEGDDILKPKIKIGKVKTSTAKSGTMTIPGKKDEGAVSPGDVHNKTNNPTPPPEKRIPKVVNPKDVDGEQEEGVSKGSGTKTVIIPNLSAQRAYPINTSLGIYKIVIKPLETYENIYISCSAVGEDGTSDNLNIETFKYEGTKINVKNDKAGPVKIIADMPSVFYVTFVSHEKMVLNLQITEEK